MTHTLFQPYTLNELRLTNRIVMAPMTRCRAAAGDVPTALMAEYYQQRASAGLIISEGTPVSPYARGYLFTPGIYTQEQIAGWRGIANAVHNFGGKIFTQIWHTGRISHTSLQPGGVAPQGPTNARAVDSRCFAYNEQGQPDFVTPSSPEPINTTKIVKVIDQFAQAAENAHTAGLDGVEIHGANGYLFDQFLNAMVNTRTDDYGGSKEARARFLLAVVDAVAARIGVQRIGVRISPYGKANAMPDDPENADTILYLAQELDRRGIAYLHANDQHTLGVPNIPEQFLHKLRAAFRSTIILCGGYTADRAKQAIDAGLADLIGFGVPFIANPDLPTRLEYGLPFNEPKRENFYGGNAIGYTDYPISLRT